MSNPQMIKSLDRKRIVLLLLLSVGLLVLYYGTITRLVRFALSSEAFSYIILIPFVSIFFFIKDRKAIFEKTHYSFLSGIIVILSGLLLYGVCLFWRSSIPQADALTLAVTSLLCSLIGVYCLCFGVSSFKKAVFPLLFLIFIIPIPLVIEKVIVEMFRAGSTEVVNMYFRIAGIPFLREGSVFQLEHLSFRVADECSGINSGLSLLIVSVIAAKLFLKNPWIRLLFILSIIPIGWSKNGLRIATLTLLSCYVNPGFMSGPLHRQGGRPFFIIALLFLGVTLFFCRALEKRIRRKSVLAPKVAVSSVDGEKGTEESEAEELKP